MNPETIAIIKNWRTLQAGLMTLTEEEVFAALNWERMSNRRVAIMERLHQRFNMMRCTRERLDIFGEVTNV